MRRPATVIRVKRVIQGLKIKDLAAGIGFCTHTISLVESGQQDASTRLQKSFADFFKCRCEELFDERGRALEYNT